jgi:hypothetical protein
MIDLFFFVVLITLSHILFCKYLEMMIKNDGFFFVPVLLKVRGCKVKFAIFNEFVF